MGLTTIPWSDYTWNPWRGCVKVSPGCKYCYIDRTPIFKFTGLKHGDPRVRAGDGTLNTPFTWNKRPWICDKCGRSSDLHYDHSCTGRKEDACHTSNVTWHRARVFSLSLGDWLDPEVPIEWLAQMLDTIRQCENLDWLLCTKRPELFLKRVLVASGQPSICGRPAGIWAYNWCMKKEAPKNVWVLTSTENQEMLDKRVPELLKIPAVVHGLSCEPLLGPLDFDQLAGSSNGRGLCWDWTGKPSHIPHCDYKAIGREAPNGPGINWVIGGGESGPNARPCHVEWLRDIQAQCKAAGVAYFCKQLGSKPMGKYIPRIESSQMRDLHQSGMVTDKKGGDISEWPEDMRVRQFPFNSSRL